MAPLPTIFRKSVIIGSTAIVLIFSYLVRPSCGKTFSPQNDSDFSITTPVADHRLTMALPNVDKNGSMDMDQPLIILFSQPVDPAFFSFEVAPEKEAWITQWSPDFTRVTLVPDTPPEPGRTFLLTAGMLSGPGIEQNVRIRRLTPVRQLNHDLKNGRIDINQGARYRVFSIFRPARVPQAYRPSRAMPSGTTRLKQVQKEFERLNEATRRELRPYFLSPLNPESFWHDKIQADALHPSVSPGGMEWAGISQEIPKLVEEVYTTDGNRELVILGLQPEAAKVRLAHHLLEKEKIYERLEQLLGAEPPGIFNNNKIFIFIFGNIAEKDEDGKEFEPMGLYFNDQESGEPVIFISSQKCRQENELGGTLAHELFHAFQMAFTEISEPWLEESTAVWAEDFINSAWNTEQDHIEDAFEAAFGRIERLGTDSEEAAYGLYLFPYFLTRVNPMTDSVVRLIWENRKDGQSEIDAVRNAVGDFDEVWKDFCLATLDAEPEDKRFPDTVGCFGGSGPLMLSSAHGWQSLFLDDQGADGGVVVMRGIQAAYFDVYNSHYGADAPAVRFDLKPFQKYADKVSVQAVIHYSDGRKVREDWTGREERLFCLNINSQNFAVIYIVVGCSDKDLILVEPLVVVPEPTSRCTSATVSLTRTIEERDQVEWTHRVTVGTTRTGSRRSESNRSVTLRLDLDLSEMIPPQSQAALDLMQARVKDVDPEQVQAVREYMEKIMQTPQTGLDEKTGLVKTRYRVKACRIQSAGGHSNSQTRERAVNPSGVFDESEINFTQHWSARGLDEGTRKRIERGNFRVEIYREPETGKILWVHIPQLDLDMNVTENSSGYRIYYGRHTDKSGGDSKDETFTMSPGSDTAPPGLPLNPVWQAKQSTGLAASGGTRTEHPVDQTSSGDGMTRSRRMMRVETFDWSINLAIINQ